MNFNVPKPFKAGIFDGYQTHMFGGAPEPIFLKDVNAKRFTKWRQDKKKILLLISSESKVMVDTLARLESGEWVAPVQWWRTLYKLLED